MRYILLILAFVIASTCPAKGREINSVLVDKSDKKMYLLSNGRILKEYDVVFGSSPKGHKQQEGDERTPEGKYILDYKKSDSSFYKAIHISYPNEEDKARAERKGANPGGLLMVHGQKNGFGWLSWLMQWFNWTDGCIAVANSDMDEIWQLVKVGTPIEIAP